MLPMKPWQVPRSLPVNKEVLKRKGQILAGFGLQVNGVIREKIYLQMFFFTKEKSPQLHWKFKQI